MKIDYPTQAQLPALRQLWKEAFRDTEEYLNLFFSTAFSPDRCLCAQLDGRPVAALYWMDCRHLGKPVAYLYAVATSNAFRRRGICRELMDYTRTHLQHLGYAGLILVPGNERLRFMYQRMGFQDATTLSEIKEKASAPALPLQRITPQEYANLRKEKLPRLSVLQEGDCLSLMAGAYTLYSGPGVLLATEESSKQLRCVEFLGDTVAIPGVLAALKKESGTFCVPGDQHPFAMWLPLTQLQPPEYFAFAFD